jgi:phage gp37-like protein
VRTGGLAVRTAAMMGGGYLGSGLGHVQVVVRYMCVYSAWAGAVEALRTPSVGAVFNVRARSGSSARQV